MIRPASIVTFERCYLAAFVLGAINTLMIGSQLPAASPLNGGFALAVRFIGLIVSAAITLALWYFVARRGSLVAKWIVVVFFAFAVITMLRAIGSGVFLHNTTGLVAIVAFVLNAVAVWMLFRPDTRAWFAADTIPGEPTA